MDQPSRNAMGHCEHWEHSLGFERQGRDHDGREHGDDLDERPRYQARPVEIAAAHPPAVGEAGDEGGRGCRAGTAPEGDLRGHGVWVMNMERMR